MSRRRASTTRPLWRRCGSTRSSSGRRWSPGRCSLGRSATSATECRTARPDRCEDDEARSVLRRLVPAAVLTLPLLLVSMVDRWHFAGWGWWALAFSTPVVWWAGLDVPPGDAGEPPPRCGHDGHARLRRHDRGVDVVVRRGARGRRGEHVLRDRGRDRHADAARPLLGGPREEPHCARDARAPRPRREDGPPRER